MDALYSNGKFLSLLSYTIGKDPKLKEIVSSIPEFAKYTSPEIQNMIIEDMAGNVREKIAVMVKDSDGDMFTIKCDGTRDRNNVENFAVVVRFVFKGQLHEHLLDVCKLDHSELDAESIANKVMYVLKFHELNPKSVISQCFDGASVMSGGKSGVQRRLQDIINEEIPYVHCFNHQLHLVVINVLNRNDVFRRLFDICGGLYNLTRRPLIAQHYDGEKLKRLLDQRWTGHLATVSVVRKCYHELLDLLGAVQTYSGSSGDDVAEAIGYAKQMKSLQFITSLAIVEKILLTLNPLNSMLQSKSMNLGMALTLLNECIKRIQNMREDGTFDLLLSESTSTSTVSAFEPPRPKRPHRQSQALVDCIIDCPLPIYGATTGTQDMRRLFIEAIDAVDTELNARFNERSMSYMKSLLALDRNKADFLNLEHLKPLMALLQRRLNISDLENEIPVVKPFILNTAAEGVQCAQEILLFLYPYKEAFPQTYKLYCAAVTFGASTATCENSFSTLTRILSPARRSMLQARMSNLVLLSFEKDITSNISGDELLAKFRHKNRRLLV
jgi:hypothetical protein